MKATKMEAKSGDKRLEMSLNVTDEDHIKNCEALSFRQMIFAEAYAATGNGVEAAIRAGYSGHLTAQGIAQDQKSL